MTKLKKARFSTLGVISTILVFSAGFRVLGVSSVAFALDSQKPHEIASVSEEEGSANSPDLARLLESFKTREAALAEEESRVSKRLEALEKAETTIAQKVKQLAASEERLRELLAIADVAAEEDVARLTSVYENMKPKAAAIVFEEMPPAFAAGFLSRMEPTTAASVMASLQPQTAYAISVVFAGRHAEQATK